jgi:hypothetical protein
MEKTNNSIALLLKNRWDVDSLIKEPISGELTWLKEFVVNGKRIGITDCCQFDYECNRHKQLRCKTENQNINFN